ncbi:tRNA (adenosine(37)-N6)-dimethylallyltransferase MiaA [Phytohalomonas tamaricis]|uniref:tRNA (adenosine(37)-N6)-dimethylallyltransferase MiaA n=1 Tax=Phytohalomonas tamaricis TaxID=2081032 RepID=UPI000D0B0FA2|nr:tRNA (adenosine(37)-N6)-dimethylallyltransferase MiaA [Phytohalomonas tamaricis]
MQHIQTKGRLPTAVFLMGPTASGKTDCAIALHEQMNAELISVDSAMVYRGMDIGTAKPSPAELARAPHRLIDIRDPAEPYSAADFRRDALAEMSRISAAGKVPVLVGGTMLYFKLLFEGAAELPEADAGVRAELEAQREREGLQALHAELSAVDPTSAARIHVNDPQRLMRALEVYRLTGQPLSEHWQRQSRSIFPWNVVSIALAPSDRAVLHKRIEHRFIQMLELGFLSEVKALRARNDLHLALPSMKSVGYRQVWEHLEGHYDLDQMQMRGIIATRQLAKRQLTWLRSWQGVHWVDSTQEDMLDKVLKIVRAGST